MEPMTHLMTGACLARAGCNRKAAYATLAMTVAAELPDVDTLWSVDGPVAGFQHHRGITHTLLGVPFEAVAVVGAVWLVHRWRVGRGGSTAAPVRWGLLYGFALAALLSHILLDWTNNYGVRPFFPFNPRWYAGSVVFIFEPAIFVALLAALVAPALFGLVNSEVGARKPAFRGRGWAIFALAVMVCLWGWRVVEHDAAIQLATNAVYGPVDPAAATVAPVPVLRVTASPYPGNPYRWHTVAETPGFYQIASADTLHSVVTTDAAQDIFYKPPATPATLEAKRSWLGEAYLDWSSWPLVTDVGLTTPNAASASRPEVSAVTFRDLRFMYDTMLLQGRRNPPLTGTVYVDADRGVARMEFGSKVQR